tara:strand:- start:92 stop:574 length:483 start_codon:yes stop_codon:yes gene_type:complete
MRNFIPVLITLIVAMCLSLLPMPEWTGWARPAWVLMVLTYWAMVMPDQVNVGVAWLAGLFLDVLTGTMIGEHALALTVAIYFVYRFHRRIHMYPMPQQVFSVLIFVLIYQSILYGVQGAVGKLPQSQLYWLSSLTTVLLWPWMSVLMRDYCRWMRVDLAK